MPLETTGFSKTFYLGDNNFEKYWAEGKLAEGENIEQLAQDTRDHVINSFIKQHPQFNKEDIIKVAFTEDIPTIQIDK